MNQRGSNVYKSQTELAEARSRNLRRRTENPEPFPCGCARTPENTYAHLSKGGVRRERCKAHMKIARVEREAQQAQPEPVKRPLMQARPKFTGTSVKEQPCALAETWK